MTDTSRISKFYLMPLYYKVRNRIKARFTIDEGLVNVRNVVDILRKRGTTTILRVGRRHGSGKREIREVDHG
jgi:hypothetical protein